MAWRDDLLDATFRGVYFAVISTRDGAERALVQHEYPYRDGTEMEDMGRRPRKFTIRAVFWGDEYAAYMDDLIGALDVSGPGELIHPVLGSVTVSVYSYEIDHHEDHPDYAEIEMVMIETGQDQPFFAATCTALGQADDRACNLAQAVADTRDWMLSVYASWVDTIAALPCVLAVAEAVSGVNAVLALARDVAALPLVVLDAVLTAPLVVWTEATAVAGAVLDTALALPEAAVGAFLPFARFAGELVALPLTVAGEVLTFPATVGSYAGAILGGPVADEPGPQPVFTLAPAVDAVTRQAPDLATVAGQAWAYGALATNLARTVAVVAEASRVLSAEITVPSLTPAEVETVVGSTRARMQAAIDDATAVLPTHASYPLAETLRTAALDIQELGRAVIHLNPPLLATAVSSPCNFHLLAHRLYGDYTRAAELARLNPGVRNPNFLAKGQTILHYAK